LGFFISLTLLVFSFLDQNQTGTSTYGILALVSLIVLAVLSRRGS
jgi:hypothetical protein